MIGQDGAVSLLRTLWEEPSNPEVQLAEGTSQAFCTIQAESGEPRFRFTHGLIHDVVYNSLEASERQRLHAAVLHVLEKNIESKPASIAHLLAWHATHSQQATAAIRYLTEMAEQAAGQFAHAEATQCVQEAQTLVRSLPQSQQQTCRLDLLLRQAQSLIAMQRWQEVIDLLAPQHPQLTQVTDASLAARHALLLSQASSGLGDWERATRHAQHALETATACQDDAAIEQAYAVLAEACYGSGRPLLGIDYSRQAIALLRAPVASSRRATAQLLLGLNALLLGEVTMALEAASEADTIATALREPPLQTAAAWLLGWIHATRGASGEGIAACQRSLDCAADPLNTAFALGWLGYAYLEHHDPAAAIPKLEQAVQQIRQWRYPRMEGLHTAFVAEALLAQEQFDTAYERAQQAFNQCQATTYAFGMGWAQRVLGRIALASGKRTVGQQHLADALATFAALPARFEMGRTHLALATAYAPEHRNPAIQHATEAYQLFQSLHVQPYVEQAARVTREVGV